MNAIIAQTSKTMLVFLASSTLCLGYQNGGLGGAAQTPPLSTPTARSAAAREQIAREALAAIDAAVAKGTTPATGTDRLLWKRRLIEAQLDAGTLTNQARQAYANELLEAEKVAQQRFQKGEISQLDYLEAKFRRLEGMTLVGQPKVAKTQGNPPDTMAGGTGGIGGDAAGFPAPPRTAPKEHPQDVARNKFIEEKLETPLTMSFPNETPLEDLLKYIKQNVPGQNGKPMPIFVNPRALEEAEKSMDSPIIMDIDGVPLRTTLRLALQQLGLDYRVREGMIFISTEDQFDEEEHPEFHVHQQLSPPARGGGGLQ